MSLTPKNWKSFQHYKDRAPAWIKLHRGLLDNIDYFRLTPLAGKVLPLIWLIASEKDGEIPAAAELAFRLRVSESDASSILSELTERGFLVEACDVATPSPMTMPCGRPEGVIDYFANQEHAVRGPRNPDQ